MKHKEPKELNEKSRDTGKASPADIEILQEFHAGGRKEAAEVPDGGKGY